MGGSIGGEQQLCGTDCAGSPCLAPLHRHRELEKVMTEVDNSKMQAWGWHFFGRILPTLRSPGCVHFAFADSALTLTVSVLRDVHCASSALGTPAHSGASDIQQHCCWIAVIVAILNQKRLSLKDLPSSCSGRCLLPRRPRCSMACPLRTNPGLAEKIQTPATESGNLGMQAV